MLGQSHEVELEAVTIGGDRDGSGTKMLGLHLPARCVPQGDGAEIGYVAMALQEVRVGVHDLSDDRKAEERQAG